MSSGIEKFVDNRGLIMWASKKLLGFDYKYLTMGTIEPKKVRGGHYHKETKEKLLCVSGNLLAIIGEKVNYIKDGDIVDIPLNKTHTIVNIGDTTAFFVEFKGKEYDKTDNDTYKK